MEKNNWHGIILFEYKNPFGDTTVNISFRDEIKDGKNICIVQIIYEGLEVIKKYNKIEMKEIMEMDYIYFYELYEKIINLKYNKLLLYDGSTYRDGSLLNIEIWACKSRLKLEINCYNTDIEKRNLIEINNLLNEIINKLKIEFII